MSILCKQKFGVLFLGDVNFEIQDGLFGHQFKDQKAYNLAEGGNDENVLT